MGMTEKEVGMAYEGVLQYCNTPLLLTCYSIPVFAIMIKARAQFIISLQLIKEKDVGEIIV